MQAWSKMNSPICRPDQRLCWAGWRKIILDNICAQLRLDKRQLIADVKPHGELRLEGFLQASGLSLENIYRKTGGSLPALLRGAGLFPGIEMVSRS